MGKDVINEPFAVINADDFYGRDAFNVIASELSRPHTGKGDYCMVGFRIGNTMSENGSVARGVCKVKGGNLASIVERTKIEYDEITTLYISMITDSRKRSIPSLLCQ